MVMSSSRKVDIAPEMALPEPKAFGSMCCWMLPQQDGEEEYTATPGDDVRTEFAELIQVLDSCDMTLAAGSEASSQEFSVNVSAKQARDMVIDGPFAETKH